ncbi:MAG: glucokinase [Sandaracinaceae bacterium]
MRILAGDVGGTKTLLAIYERADDGAFTCTARERFDSRHHEALSPLVAGFIETRGPIAAAAFGVAGPVQDGVCHTTNLPWIVDAAELSRSHGIADVSVLNDFEATALGVDALAGLPADLATLLPLSSAVPLPDEPRAVFGAGTGLGAAILVPTPGPLPTVLRTEAGHADFAPRTDFERALDRTLRARYGRTSVERVLSGEGLGAIYATLLAQRGEAPTPSVAAELAAASDPAAAIGAAASHDAAAREAVERFVDAYGSEAGNFAVRCLPLGGMFIAGGIGPKHEGVMASGRFLERFLDKEPMREILARVPLALVLEPDVALLGARRAAVASLG